MSEHERTLGVSAIETGVNCLQKATCYTDLGMAQFTKHNNPTPNMELYSYFVIYLVDNITRWCY